MFCESSPYTHLLTKRGGGGTFETNYLPYKMRSRPPEMSSLQSKSISTTVAWGGAASFQASSVSPCVNIFGYFLAQQPYNAHSSPISSNQRIRSSKTGLISSAHLRSVPGQDLQNILRIIFPQQRVEYHSAPLGGTTHFDFDNRESNSARKSCRASQMHEILQADKETFLPDEKKHGIINVSSPPTR